jgi:sarcosine oxidase subunit beta
VRSISADVAIVGGGIIGLSTAFFLRQKGKRVVVLERSDLAQEASGLNGGGVRQQGRFLPELPLALGAVRLWERLDGLLGRPTGYRQIGNLFVAESDAQLEALAAEREREAGWGLATEMLDAGQVRELAPGLSPHFVGGKFCPTDGHAMPAQATLAIGAAARAAGAEVLTGVRVDRIGLAGRQVAYAGNAEVRVEAPIVLDAAGPWAPYVSQLAEVYLPIFPNRAHVSHTAPIELLAQPYVLTAAWDLGACQWADGRMQLGGGENLADVTRFSFDKRPQPGFVEIIRHRAPRVFPALQNVPLERVWAGTRECTPDMMPIIGPVDGPDGFLVCAGFSGHGFALGPYAGQLMAEWIVDGRPSLDLESFSYRRFLRPEGPLTVEQRAIAQTG